jgi:hypothetical protein
MLEIASHQALLRRGGACPHCLQVNHL